MLFPEPNHHGTAVPIRPYVDKEGSHINYSGSCGLIRLISLGGGWPEDVRFPRRSEDSPPLVVVWAEDVLIMRQAKML